MTTNPTRVSGRHRTSPEARWPRARAGPGGHALRSVFTPEEPPAPAPGPPASLLALSPRPAHSPGYLRGGKGVAPPHASGSTNAKEFLFFFLNGIYTGPNGEDRERTVNF